MQNLSVIIPETKSLLNALTKHLSHTKPVKFDTRELSVVLHVFQIIKNESIEENNFSLSLLGHVDASKDTNMSLEELSGSLHSLASISGKNTLQDQRIMSIVIDLLKSQDHSPVPKDYHLIGSMLFSLQTVTEKTLLERELIGLIALKISKADDCINGVGIGNSIYGLMKLTGECPESRSLIRNLSYHIQSLENVIFNDQSVCNIFYGIRNLQVRFKEVNLYVLF